MLSDYFLKDVGIDLGTANSLIYLKNHGVMVNEPSVAALNNKTNEILAVGENAKKMLGRTPYHIDVVKPLINGVVSDFDITKEYLRELLKLLKNRPFIGFRKAVLAVPADLTEVERKSVEDAALSAGAAKVFLIDAALCAALGADLPIESPVATLIIDIGGGTTDIAVISLGGIVVSKTLKTAGDKFNDDIMRFLRDEFRLAVGEPTAEFVKIAVGSAIPVDERLETTVRGRDFNTGLPKEIAVKNTHIRSALAKSLRSIVDSLREIIESVPPELAGDMLEHGIFLSGGGALLRGLDQLVEKETGVSVKIVDDPLTATIRGLGKIVDDLETYKHLLVSPLKPLEISL